MELKEVEKGFSKIRSESEGAVQELANRACILTETVNRLLFEMKAEIQELKETVQSQGDELSDLRRDA